MSTTMKTNDETRIAEEIVRVLPGESVARTCCDDRDTICFAVRVPGLELRKVVLRRASLRKLASDPARAIKIEYLQRELLRGAGLRSEFRYPNATRLGTETLRPLAAMLTAMAR